jgi:hypothetical protein
LTPSEAPKILCAQRLATAPDRALFFALNFWRALKMAIENGTIPMYSHAYGSADPWAMLFFATDSLRSELTNTNNIVSEQAHRIDVNVLQTAAATQVAIERTATANALAIERISGALCLQAANNHASILSKLAECCCEIKQKVDDEGHTTRELINSIEADRLRVENNQLQARLLALEIRGNGGGGHS